MTNLALYAGSSVGMSSVSYIWWNMAPTPDQRLYTLQLSRRDLGWILDGLEEYVDLHRGYKEPLALLAWLSQVYEGAPDAPAYFWLGEEGERIAL